MKARVYVTLKKGVLDPQGKAIESSIASLGFQGVTGVRQGKYFELDLAVADREEAAARLGSVCAKLLANPVIEDYRFEIE